MGPKTATPPVIQVTKPSRAPWWRTATKGQLIFAVIVLVLVIFGILSGLDVVLVFCPGAAPLLPVADLAAAILCGWLLVRVVNDARKRAQLVQQRLVIVAEMNHHIRNALQEIKFTAHTTHCQQAAQRIDVAASRIEWALREILPRDLCSTNNKE